MITTREVNVDLAKEKLKLRRVTTKNIDPSLRVEPPKAGVKPRGVSTTTQADVADIAEKKRRDDIAKEKKVLEAAEKKLAMKDKKKLAQIADEIEQHFPEIEVKKKPWNKMNAKERKEYQVEKARKEKK